MLAAALLSFFQEDPLAAQSLVNGEGDARGSSWKKDRSAAHAATGRLPDVQPEPFLLGRALRENLIRLAGGDFLASAADGGVS